MNYLSLKEGTPAEGYWDQTLLKDLGVKNNDIYVIPGAYQADYIDEINAIVRGKTAIVTSDEESNFPTERLEAAKIFVSYPKMPKHQNVDGYLPIGYAPDTRKYVRENGMGAKSLDWFFAGQDTHQRRHDCIQALKGLEGGKLVATEGFAQGLDYKEYMQYMCRAKVVPCPAGPFSPDSFRLYEALEAGCIPIPENKEFWKLLFGEVPFPVVDEWSELPQLIQHYKDRPDINNKCQAWWLLKKRELKWKLQ